MNDEAEHVLDWLQGWYLSHCDGRWEHERGVQIDTLDNPGWTVSVDLRGTPLEGRAYPRREIDRSDDDWVEAWSARGAFHAACGPRNLTEALMLFRTWAEECASGTA
ncbi:immunity 53 family protein [Streptacidiphilus sp. ASG 303]|uniref:immunity 53 family protein n=1 Tax=Streptacidiphilus sp. ASG 303 TaxID=2896847 RepID=UPI001E598C26|nr:immunity 53 family protein [Streptacidiphilus sp. ASG 303]MCD0482806.1 immunity 53 family protein [Streptacidiphilus sp. ASG 303]